ncbi:hypothetical protein Amet_2259 [Alkaliphilus metalliredigens QYMF]|uniref:Uncharacterized protein n=1 Tax=Alkaliphilus metalliredigens (strain QYMF) TaxID=293826 RepID=A6TQE9_ALKMQ|nr:hypothetical protein Amet_2259 [Alkaliphilus metalliredigens QYMF]
MAQEALYMISTLSQKCYTARKDEVSYGFPTLCDKMLTLTISIRELLLMGQDDNALCLFRVFMEACELGVVSLFEDNFTEYIELQDDPVNQKKFWSRNIAKGNIYVVLKKILDSIDFPEDMKNSYINVHRQRKDYISGSIHLNAGSILRGSTVPSYIHKDYFVSSTLGHVSLQAPSIYYGVLDELYYFSLVLTQSVRAENIPNLFRDMAEHNEYRFAIKSLLYFQEVYNRFDDRIVELIETDRE